MPNNDYSTLVADYTAELSELFAPEAARAVGRPPRAPSPDELADRAERLAPRAADLSRATAEFLNAGDPSVRLGAEQNLLAQAAAALRVADGLRTAAGEEEEEETRSAGSREMPAFDDLMAIIQAPLADAGLAVASEPEATRGRAPKATAEELLAACDAAIEQILDGVGSFGRDALAGLVGLDTALLKKAAQLIGGQASETIAKLGEQASRLVSKAVAFVVQAYDSILAALGQDVTSELRVQAAEWVERLQEGDLVANLLGGVFETSATRERIADLVAASAAAAPALGLAEAAVEALPAGYAARTRLAGQILAGLGILKRIPAARVPMVELATGAAYLVLLGFVLYSGGDYVDAPKLEKLGRVPGVLHVVETGLVVQP